MTSIIRGAAAALVLIASTGQGPALAAASDYDFTPVSVEVKKGKGVEVAVRLVDKRTGKSVPDAVITRFRVDMSPEGMETMTAAVKALPSTEPGVYRFQTDLVMAGGWAVKLMARVQGEADSVHGTVVVKASD
ncbi:FixH family protein [Chelatococcus sp. SYSU_G07232]|uniref:FixH family protein n=1 Tax=Chelatococcus albus TaxID=3047466 RepID=A0ABT7ABS1_9HYPH|nr:FixH family protein [Chelatococcus sp. SYSU_G07232]MDJ1156799.1 FixH family protein [Chelatococcus sp. SYSU_G07232]